MLTTTVQSDTRRSEWFASWFDSFTSFGYFEQPGEHMAVVRNMATSLRHGGALVLD